MDSQDNQLDAREFPYPATKLIIGKYFWVHPTGCSWACLVVGSFYDAEDRELWRSELLLGDRGDEDSSSDSDSDSEPHILATDSISGKPLTGLFLKPCLV